MRPDRTKSWVWVIGIGNHINESTAFDIRKFSKSCTSLTPLWSMLLVPFQSRQVCFLMRFDCNMITYIGDITWPLGDTRFFLGKERGHDVSLHEHKFRIYKWPCSIQFYLYSPVKYQTISLSLRKASSFT